MYMYEYVYIYIYVYTYSCMLRLAACIHTNSYSDLRPKP